MELYISDHPLDCLTCAANGDCELQDMAGAVGLRDVRYGYDGESHTRQESDRRIKPHRLAKHIARENEFFRLLESDRAIATNVAHLFTNPAHQGRLRCQNEKDPCQSRSTGLMTCQKENA